MEIKPATRVGVIPLIGAYAESGCGKTMSSLLLARGFVGSSGKIAMIDTESGRGSLYADVIPGGYDVLTLEPPFSPARYAEALQTVFKAGYGIVVVDSMSHEHEGIGGVLDMAGENESRSGKSGLHNWKVPKMEHAKLVQQLLRAPIPLVCCIRAKYKTRQVKENGKTAIVKDDHTSPIQSEDFIYEMTAHFEVLSDHSINLTKCSHPALRSCFPTKGPITQEHGRMIAAWCAAPSDAKPATANPAKEIAALKKHLWTATTPRHGGSRPRLQGWLIDEMIMTPEESLETLTVERLREVVDKSDAMMAGAPA